MSIKFFFIPNVCTNGNRTQRRRRQVIMSQRRIIRTPSTIHSLFSVFSAVINQLREYTNMCDVITIIIGGENNKRKNVFENWYKLQSDKKEERLISLRHDQIFFSSNSKLNDCSFSPLDMMEPKLVFFFIRLCSLSLLFLAVGLWLRRRLNSEEFQLAFVHFCSQFSFSGEANTLDRWNTICGGD